MFLHPMRQCAADLANALDKQKNITGYRLEVENFEAIHNHSAYALIERDKRVAVAQD